MYKFFKGINPHDRAAAVEKRTPDWNDLGPREQQILRALYLADEGSIVTYSGSTSGKQMAELREANELPPEERVLAHVSLSRDDKVALIFGCLAMYFPATQNGEPIRCSVSYDTVPRRRFVNHGQGVYIGDGIVLTPANRVSCEVLAALLNAVRRAVAESVP